MNKSNWFAHIYGYVVCLVAVITFLVCVGNSVSAAFDLSDPLLASGEFEQQRSLSSVDNYRMYVLGSWPQGQMTPSEASILGMYEAARDAQIRSVRLRSVRDISVSGLLILVSVGLFVTHWRWLRRVDRRDASERPRELVESNSRAALRPSSARSARA